MTKGGGRGREEKGGDREGEERGEGEGGICVSIQPSASSIKNKFIKKRKKWPRAKTGPSMPAPNLTLTPSPWLVQTLVQAQTLTPSPCLAWNLDLALTLAPTLYLLPCPSF